LKNAYLVWIVASVLCSSIAHFALKLGALRMDLNGGLASLVLRFGANRWLIFGAVLHALALSLWVVGLKHVELSVAYPFIALGLVLVSFLAYVFLNEALGAVRLVGMLLVAFGVVLIART
jgi:multidrug transporter EmrE-like cation transporter